MATLFAHAWLLLLCGAAAGLLAGLFGVGGGLVIVPALYFLLHQLGVDPATAMAIAVGTSLTSIIPTSMASLSAHHKLGNVHWPLVRRWAPFVVGGVLVGAWLVARWQSPVLILWFALLLLAVALNKLAGQRLLAPRTAMPALGVQRITASVIGFISALAGVGGGATGVPTLVYFGLPIHQAVGTCAALGLFIALPGALSIVVFGSTPAAAPNGTFSFIYLPALLWLAPLTVVCAPIGARLGKRISAKWLSRGFALLLIVVGVRMLLSLK